METTALAYIISLLFICIALSFGSFTNVLIYRVPRDLSIVKPGSFCTSCKHSLSLIDNIPLFSYIFLRGKCRFCSTPIAAIYPIVEFLVALITMPLIYTLVWNPISKLQGSLDFVHIKNFCVLGFLVVFISIAVSLAFIDQKFHKLPHELTYSGILIGLIYSFFFGDLGLAIISVGAVLFVFDCITHFANKLFFKERALAIAPASLTFRTSFLSQKITWIYLLIVTIAAYLAYISLWKQLGQVFLVIGILYIINDIFIDFFFLPASKRQEFYSNRLKKKPDDTPSKEIIDNEPLTALGGGDAAMTAFVASFLYLKIALFSLMAAFYIALVLTLLEYLILKVKGSKEASLSNKLIPLGSSLAIAAIIAMIIEYIF